MSVKAMSGADPNMMQPVGQRVTSNSTQDLQINAGAEANCAVYRPSFSSARDEPAFNAHSAADPRYSLYNVPRQGAYPEYADRYSAGCQRIGQTITLTSHKIQFGCQGAPTHYGYGGRRYGEHGYRGQYHMLPPPPSNKTWPDPTMERPSSSNSKSNNRGRTTYSDEQIAELEGVFNSNPYPTSQTRQHLAFKIDVPEGKVKIWFQNRRARAKKSKMSCGGGPWRPQHDSGNGEDRTNQNNNNAKDCGKLLSTTPSMPISSILPLPTKTTMNTSNWRDANYSRPWRGYEGAGQVSCHCSAEDCYNRNLKPWNWAFGARADPTQSIAYRTNEIQNGLAHPVHSGRDKTRVGSHDWQASTWNSSGTHSGVPGLISQTSEVGINETNMGMVGFQNKVIDSDSSHLAVPGPSQSTPASTALLCQERCPTLMPNGSTSPPPIRRLIYPFHTLSDGDHASRSELITAGSFGYPTAAASDAYPCMEAGAGYSGFQGAPNETRPTFPYAKRVPICSYTESSQGNAVGPAESYALTQIADSKWDGGSLANKFISETGEAKAEYGGNPLNDDRSPQTLLEVDDDETDDAIDESGIMDETGSMEFASDRWSGRPTSNILVKAMEYAEDEDIQSKQDANDRASSGLESLNHNTGPGESEGSWPVQFVGGIYPSVSASMVG